MRKSMPELSTIYDYMRAHAGLLGARILEQFPALKQIDDPVSPRIEGLLRRPFPAQNIAIMGLAKRWRQARTGIVVAECGTGKTLISLGAIHVHSEGKPFTALAMVPPHLVEKWAREAFLTLPGVRVFLIDDLRNGGDENKHQGNALGTLASCTDRIVGLTGTLLGGYADDLFNTMFRLEAGWMKERGYEWGTTGRSAFTQDYGVLETITKVEPENNRCSKAKTTSMVRRKPGASPLLFGEFLMQLCAFLFLED